MILKQKPPLLIQLEQHLQELTDILIELWRAKIQQDMDIIISFGYEHTTVGINTVHFGEFIADWHATLDPENPIVWP